ncbi:hypothetical protein AB1Y20_013319 [Prymnesium parvum]|uniref:Biogenesis of lysosome-related organelles complex 1 subunit 1 n=1 Tax=Prymnesium parvum TaxID=97485 RepID=A0AB34IN65_PRYPA
MSDWGSIWSSVRDAATTAANATVDAVKQGSEVAGKYTEKAVHEAGRMATQTRLRAEIAMLDDRMEQVKKRWGANAYSAMVAGDMATVHQHLDVAKAEMESLMLELAEKRSELAVIDGEPATAYPDYSAAVGARTGVPVPPMTAPQAELCDTDDAGFATSNPVPVGEPYEAPSSGVTRPF